MRDLRVERIFWEQDTDSTFSFFFLVKMDRRESLETP